MGWFIAGVLVLLLIGGLIGFGRARERDRQPADDTLLAELLGEDVTPPPPPPPLAAVRLDDRALRYRDLDELSARAAAWLLRRGIRAGDRVGLFYRSANFDEEVFDHPEEFDILRNPNPHLGFGGTGTHYCIGVNLAKLEIELIFNAIADAMPDIHKAGEPERLRSGWLNGIKRLPVGYA